MVQCGIYHETWERRCDAKLWEEDLRGTAEFRAGDSLLNDSDKNEIREREYQFSSVIDDLDDSGDGYGGSATCPADHVINLGPIGTIRIPMSFICDWAERMRPLVIALGWLSAALIVMGRLGGDK